MQNNSKHAPILPFKKNMADITIKMNIQFLETVNASVSLWLSIKKRKI